MTILISPRKCSYSPHKRRIWCSRREPLLCYIVPLNGAYCRLTMSVVKRRCARDAPPYTFDVGMFKSGKNVPPQHIFTMNLRTYLTDAMLLLTPKFVGISHKLCNFNLCLHTPQLETVQCDDLQQMEKTVLACHLNPYDNSDITHISNYHS